ncbi:DUF3822 family protein [Aureivirga sp. CE67]|uniref:DUF3822 family protein n=1 Tax=Aureivirga sp. CE67 TaxID=1788983 RepID=UPI0018C9C32B|nr:DUF3822 family protein [Aureivirga sp. CE67]
MMRTKKVQITNKKTDFKNLENSRLSIQISLDGFSFCIYDEELELFTALLHYEFDSKAKTPTMHLENIMNIFKENVLLQKAYKKVQVIHSNNMATFVPKVFFDEKYLKSYLKHTVKVFDNDFIVYDEILQSEIVSVYIPFVNVNNFLFDHFGAFEYTHSSSILVKKLIDTYKNTNKQYIFIHVEDHSFEMVFLDNGNFKMYNSFQYRTKEDFIYYILFTAEQLSLNPEAFELVFLGAIDEKSDLYKIAHQYIRNISFVENSQSKLKNLPDHSFYTLLNY